MLAGFGSSERPREHLAAWWLKQQGLDARSIENLRVEVPALPAGGRTVARRGGSRSTGLIGEILETGVKTLESEQIPVLERQI